MPAQVALQTQIELLKIILDLLGSMNNEQQGYHRSNFLVSDAV